MHDGGLANWALTMGRQRLGALTLHNHPQFLQNLPMPRLAERDGQDRRRGARPHSRPRARRSALQRVPPAIRAAELTSFDDFIDTRLARDSPGAQRTGEIRAEAARDLRPAPCDASKVITAAQLDDRRQADHRLPRIIPTARMVDNIEDLDTVVGWLAESHAAARLRDLGDAVHGLHPQRVAASVQRPLLHVQLPSRVLHDPRRRVGDEQRSGRQHDGSGTPNGHAMKCRRSKRVLLRTFPSCQGSGRS